MYFVMPGIRPGVLCMLACVHKNGTPILCQDFWFAKSSLVQHFDYLVLDDPNFNETWP